MLKRFLISAFIAVSVFSASRASAENQDIIRMNSDIIVSKETVANDVVAIGGDITVYGKVEKNVVAVGGSVTLKKDSSVGGQVVIVGGMLIKDQGAVVGNKVTQIYMPPFIPSIIDIIKGKWIFLWATLSLLAILGFLGLAILFTALLPEHIGVAVKVLDNSFMTMLLWGLLWVILVMPIMVLLAVSIVGIILIPAEIFLVALAMIVGYIVSAIFVGKRILSSYKNARIPFADVILGVIVLSLVGFTPVIGPFIKAIFLLAGFGAVLTTRFGTIK